ncbi:integration host factor subunit alpha [Paucibacter oligotrophus]|uniref:Integration host factor subunit alpha n=1 Tax=Roseateles oligotrophus TaxID=1769250 RepID=A0A840LEN8_9BURK|nr:integration host factor subunit alpha [Roseateles oligotrophus]
MSNLHKKSEPNVRPEGEGADPAAAAAKPAARVLLPSLETPTLTKAELSELLFDKLGLNKRESKDMVEAFFDIIHGRLVEGDDVKLSGFGNFNIRRKAPRPGRNPRTGESIPIKARDVVTFHASHKLKSLVQGDVCDEDDIE